MCRRSAVWPPCSTLARPTARRQDSPVHILSTRVRAADPPAGRGPAGPHRARFSRRSPAHPPERPAGIRRLGRSEPRTASPAGALETCKEVPLSKTIPDLASPLGRPVTELTPYSNGVSPFDRIKHTRLDGSEFWRGRELGAEVQYTQWRNFKSVIVSARDGAIKAGEAVDLHFCGTPQKLRDGRMGDDWELSRHGAYLVMMAADSTKPMVAEAKSYFAHQARAAEVMKADLQSMPPDIQRDIAMLLRQGRLENEQRRQGAQIDAHAAELQRLTTELDGARKALEAANRRIEAVENDEGWPTARSYAIRQGFLRDPRYLSAVSRKARVIAKEHGIDPIEVPDVHHGTHNSYPDWVWAAAFPLVNPAKYQAAA